MNPRHEVNVALSTLIRGGKEMEEIERRIIRADAEREKRRAKRRAKHYKNFVDRRIAVM